MTTFSRYGKKSYMMLVTVSYVTLPKGVCKPLSIAKTDCILYMPAGTATTSLP